MPLNPVFENTLQGGTSSNEFNLLESLIIESMKQFGYEVKYLPRTLVDEDYLFGEDPLSTFDVAAGIEMYIKNVDGFGGEGDFLSRFGLEIRDSITFTVARKRFNQFQDECVMTEHGWNFLTEGGDEFLLENASGDNYALSLGRPREGDLIYFPLTGKIYEIQFVEHEDVFYQLGNLYTYDLRCELFEYSSQRIDTGNTIIDGIANTYTFDTTSSQMIMEGGDLILREDGGAVILEGFRIETQDDQANNEFFATQSTSIVDFSEVNPFSEV